MGGTVGLKAETINRAVEYGPVVLIAPKPAGLVREFGRYALLSRTYALNLRVDSVRA
jgi:hypothetical protein